MSYLWEKADPQTREKLVSFETETERQSFFSFLPQNFGIRGFQVRFLLYSLTPTSIERRCTHLKKADAVVFVADSLAERREANLLAFEHLGFDLGRCEIDLARVPLVLQYNKRDLGEIRSVEEMDRDLRTADWPRVEAVATMGTGVFATLKECGRLLVARGVAVLGDVRPR